MNALVGEPREVARISAFEAMDRFVEWLWPGRMAQNRIRKQHFLEPPRGVVGTGQFIEGFADSLTSLSQGISVA